MRIGLKSPEQCADPFPFAPHLLISLSLSLSYSLVLVKGGRCLRWDWRTRCVVGGVLPLGALFPALPLPRLDAAVVLDAPLEGDVLPGKARCDVSGGGGGGSGSGDASASSPTSGGTASDLTSRGVVYLFCGRAWCLYDLSTLLATEPSALPVPPAAGAGEKKKSKRKREEAREQQRRALGGAPWAKRLAAHAETRPIDEAATRGAAERKLALLSALLDGSAKEPVQRILVRLGVLQWQLVGGKGTSSATAGGVGTADTGTDIGGADDGGPTAFATVEVFGGRVEHTRAADGSMELNAAVREARVVHNRDEVIAAWLHDRDESLTSPGGRGEVARALASGTMAQLRLCAAPPVDVAGTPVTIVELLHVSLFPSNPRLGLFVRPSRALIEFFARYVGDDEGGDVEGGALLNADRGSGGDALADAQRRREDNAVAQLEHQVVVPTRRLSVAAALGAFRRKIVAVREDRAATQRKEAEESAAAAGSSASAVAGLDAASSSVGAADRLLLVRLARVDAVHVRVARDKGSGAALPPLEWREKLWGGGWKGLGIEACKTLLASAPAAAWHAVRATAKEKQKERREEERRRKRREETEQMLQQRWDASGGGVGVGGGGGASDELEREAESEAAQREADERERVRLEEEEIEDFLGGS